jgi:group I intron endonuclease
MKFSAREKPSVIYKITNTVNGKFYIGVTTQLISVRFSQHICHATTKSPQGMLPKAIRKYGRDAFVIEQLDQLETGVDGLAAEAEYIAILKPQYNCTEGGLGQRGMIVSDETRAKISVLKTGNRYRAGTRNSEATRQKQRERGLANRDKFAVFAKMGPEASKRSVICLNDGRTFPSAAEASANYGVSQSIVVEVCNRNPRRITAKGNVFRYVDDNHDPNGDLAACIARKHAGPRARAMAMRKMVECVNDGAIYPCLADAGAAYGIHKSFVSEVCRGEKASAHGLKFQYVEA